MPLFFQSCSGSPCNQPWFLATTQYLVRSWIFLMQSEIATFQEDRLLLEGNRVSHWLLVINIAHENWCWVNMLLNTIYLLWERQSWKHYFKGMSSHNFPNLIYYVSYSVRYYQPLIFPPMLIITLLRKLFKGN